MTASALLVGTVHTGPARRASGNRRRRENRAHKLTWPPLRRPLTSERRGDHQTRQVFTGISCDDLKETVEKMLKAYLRHRDLSEGFQAFTARHDLNALQAMFSNEE